MPAKVKKGQAMRDALNALAMEAESRLRDKSMWVEFAAKGHMDRGFQRLLEATPAHVEAFKLLAKELRKRASAPSSKSKKGKRT